MSPEVIRKHAEHKFLFKFGHIHFFCMLNRFRDVIRKVGRARLYLHSQVHSTLYKVNYTGCPGNKCRYFSLRYFGI